jgi:hypothetical protein
MAFMERGTAMDSFSPLGNHRQKNRLSYRVLTYIFICSTVFTFISTAIQPYAEYQKDIGMCKAGLNQIRQSYLKLQYEDGPESLHIENLYVEYFLATPIIFGSEAIGLLAVGNKENGYTGERNAQK